MKIVSSKLSPYAHKILATMVAKSLQYEVGFIDIEEKPDWFLRISPHGKVPLLITDEEDVLFESDAIVEYLDEAYEPRLLPGDLAQRAKARAWTAKANELLIRLHKVFDSTQKEDFEKYLRRVFNGLIMIDELLSQQAYISGPEFGLADTAWIPLMYRCELIKNHSNTDLLSQFMHINRWLEDVRKRPCYKQSVADDFDKLFVETYLKNNEFLHLQN